MKRSEILKDLIANAKEFLSNEKFKDYVVTSSVFAKCLIQYERDLAEIESGQSQDTEENTK